MKTLIKSLVRYIPASTEFQEKLLLLGRVGYWPDFDNPKTLNEKVNWRKLYSTNPLYVTCSDKLAVREYVEERIGSEYLVPILYSGESITSEEILALGDRIVVKTNHDCGSVFIIKENSPDIAEKVSRKVKRSLKIDFGADSNQWWYSKIPPRVYVEKMLEDKNGEPPKDFKFSLYRTDAPDSPWGVVKIDYNRNQECRARTYYSLDRNVMPGVHRESEYRSFPEIENYDEMLRVAKTLAEGFDYVRIDLYSVAGKTYFGEMTFSQSGGRTRLTREADLNFGSHWPLDTREGGSERPLPA